MLKNAENTAQNILEIIKNKNIISVTNCLTRLRINLINDAKIDFEKIKQVPYVMGIVIPSENEIQIILGPGFVNKVTQKFKNLLNYPDASNDINTIQNTLESNIQTTKIKFGKKNKIIRTFFSKFSKIFSPMIIGFIGAGILAGIAGIIQSSYGGIISIKTAPAIVISWYNLLSLLLNLWRNAFIVIVGWRTAEVFGGSGVLGAMTASIYSPVFQTTILPMLVINSANGHINYLGIDIVHPTINWLTVGFYHADQNNNLQLGTPSGNILGALLTATAVLWIEKGVRKISPGVLDTIITPTITLFIVLLINIFLIIPISGYLYVGVSFLFTHLYTNPLGSFILAAIFLVAVAFGIHQGFIPIYSILITQTQVNGLFPILGMAGFSQLGTGIALLLLSEKGSDLRKQVNGAIIPAIFGIGEPMIYGVTLPRIKPFITSSIGAGFGGLFLGAIYLWGHVTFGLNAMFGPSGILAAFMMTTNDGNIGLAVGIYLIGALISIIAGCFITLLSYSKFINLSTKKIMILYKVKNWKKRTLLIISNILIIPIIIYMLIIYYKVPSKERKLITREKLS